MHSPEPSIICIGGALSGQEFPLTDAETVVGRDAKCGIPVQDGSMSRRHFAIRRSSDGTVTLEDLESHNGTFVNDVPVRQTALSHQDRIQAGRSLFVLQVPGQGEEVSSHTARAVYRDSTDTKTSLRLARTSVEERARSLHRPARELAALLAISTAIHDQSAVEPLARRLLTSLGEAIPEAAASVVILFHDGLDEPPWTLASEATEDRSYDDVLVRTAISEETAVLEQSVLVAPVAARSRAFGALYLAAKAGASFDTNHLQLAAAAGAIAGLAFDAARRHELAEAENRRLREQLDLHHDMVGESARMKAVYRFVARVAPAPSTILITGESGTGKELVARAIHRNSPRAHKPFIAINCASLGENLLESELFGHEKGAFTGAIVQKKGKFEIASGGTVFLDELGEMPLATQAKLLRVLQEREFERLGGTRTIPVDIRIVAATNRILADAIKAGTFRQDLFYRLNVVAVDLPSLRDRREDIPLLAAYFTARSSRQIGRTVEGISQPARTCLLHYDWPGNVRELENAIERAVVLGSSIEILPEDLPEMVVDSGAGAISLGDNGYHSAVVELKKRLIVEALDRSKGSVTEAARLLKLHPNYLHRLMNNLNLRAE
jgi:Nif-specific regulatory protein